MEMNPVKKEKGLESFTTEEVKGLREEFNNVDFEGLIPSQGFSASKEIEIDDSNPYLGFGDICSDFNDNVYVAYSSRSEHQATEGVVKIAISKDKGKTFETPTVFAGPETGRDFLDPTITFDRTFGMFYLAYVDKSVNEGSGEMVIRRGTTMENLLKAENRATVEQPFDYKNFGRSKVKRLQSDLYIAVYGRDAEESETIENPVVLRSNDEGATWSVHKKFTDMYCGEATIYFARSPENELRMCLMARKQPYSGNSGLLVYSDNLGYDWSDPIEVGFSVSGGPAIFEMGSYLLLIARHDGRGGHGYASYSIDGVRWSTPEFFTSSRPVYAGLTKLTTGEVLTMHNQEYDQNKQSKLLINHFEEPSYTDVKERLKDKPAKHKVLNREIRQEKKYESAIPSETGYKGLLIVLRVYSVTGTFELGQGVKIQYRYGFGVDALHGYIWTEASKNTGDHIILLHPDASNQAENFIVFGDTQLKMSNIPPFPTDASVRVIVEGTFADGEGIDCEVDVQWI